MTKQDLYKSSFPALTGFRFLSASLVFLFHYNPFTKGSFFWGIFNEMYAGVGMFLVLSGFLITYNYYDAARLNKRFFKVYFTKRLARIYPVYFILTGLYFGYHFFRQPVDEFWIKFVLNVSLLKGFSDKYLLTGISQAWSLTTEECFYLAAPFIYWLIKGKKLFWQQLSVIVLSGAALVLLFGYFLHASFFENFHFLFIATFFGRCFEFFVGIQLALWIKKSPEAIGKNFRYWTLTGLILIVVVIIVMSGVRSYYNTDYASSSVAGLVANNIFLPLAVACLLLGLIRERTVLSRFFSTPALILLGQASYVFYLIHAGLLADSLIRITGNSLLLKFLLLQLLSIGIFLLIEKPINRWIRRRAGVN